MNFQPIFFFFSFINIFTNDMIKTPVFCGAFLKNIKIRIEFIKRISLIKKKSIVISFW